MRTLDAKDIETLENTSVASAALAATVGLGADGFLDGCHTASCSYDSTCEMITCISFTCFISSPVLMDEAPADFVALLRQALAR